jgi:hypothetical protein
MDHILNSSTVLVVQMHAVGDCDYDTTDRVITFSVENVIFLEETQQMLKGRGIF